MANIRPTLKTIVFAGLFLVPFIPFLVSAAFFFPFIVFKTFAFRIVIEIIFAAWVLLALIDTECRPKRSPILYSIIAFLAVIGIADLFGAAPIKSFWSNFERMEGFITLLHLGMYFLVAASTLKEIHWKRWWNVSLAASVIMALIATMQVIGVLPPSQGGARVDATLGNAIYLAVYSLFHFFIALIFMWKNWKVTALHWTYGFVALIQIFVIYHTATRGAILGLIGGILVVAILNLRKPKDDLETKDQKKNKDASGSLPVVRRASIILLLSVAMLVGGFFAFRDSEFLNKSPVFARFSSLNLDEIRSQGRYFVWPIAWQGFKDRPVLGWGQENFSYVFSKYYKPEMYHLEPWFDRAHNIFLDWLVAGGVLGLASYLALYATLLFLIWKKTDLSHMERSVLTGLVAAYFFHNLFVFDHLVSYIFFFALLAYIHFVSTKSAAPTTNVEPRESTLTWTMPVAVIVLSLVLYFVNIKPIMTNAYVIKALVAIQTPGSMGIAPGYFYKAYASSPLGRGEVVEQMAMRSLNILPDESVPIEEREKLHSFVKDVVSKEAEKFTDDARTQMMAGNFFFSTGFLDESLHYLQRAEEISPGKQRIKIDIAEVYIQKKDYAKAIEYAKRAHEMDPMYEEAKFSYAVTAIYAGDRALEKEVKDIIYAGDVLQERKLKEKGTTVDLETWVTSDIIIKAYLTVGRLSDAAALLEERTERDPTNVQNYASLVSVYVEMGEKNKAVELLKKVAVLFPDYKEQVDAYLKEIQQ